MISPTAFTPRDGRGNAGAAVGALVLSAAAWMLVAWPYAISGFLAEDDAIFLPKAVFGQPMSAAWGTSLTHELLNASAEISGTVVAPKVISVLMAGLMAAGIALLLNTLTDRPVISVFAGTALVVYPLSPTVGVFALGSHPYFAGVPVVIAIILFLNRRIMRGAARGIDAVGFILIGGFVLTASVMSPNARLMVFAPAVWVVADAFMVADKKMWNVFGSVALSSWPILVAVALGNFDYHYRSVPGWVDTSIDSAVQSLRDAVGVILYPINASAPWSRATLLGSVLGVTLAIGAIALRNTRDDSSVLAEGGPSSVQEGLGGTPLRSRPPARAVMTLLVTGALGIAPGLAATNYQPRYAVLAFVFTGCALIVGVTQVIRGRGWMVAIAVLGLLLGASVGRAMDVLDAQRGGALESHRAMATLVEEHSTMWKPGAQVVAIFPNDARIPTVGYNHWSTWYLRSLTGRDDVLGLIGREAWLGSDPFVEEYRDHGDEYWDLDGTRARRIRMKGLERGRPLYLYRVGRAGTAQTVDTVAFVTGTGLDLVATGGVPGDGVSRGEAVRACAEGDEAPMPWIATDQGLERGEQQAPAARGTHGLEWSFDGLSAEVFDVDVAEGQEVDATITVRASGTTASQSFSDTSPPMPLLSPTLALYQRPDGYSLYDRAAETGWNTTTAEGSLEVGLFGVEGCVIVVAANGRIVGALSHPSVTGSWHLGKGYKQRYWQGTLYVEGLPMNRQGGG